MLPAAAIHSFGLMSTGSTIFGKYSYNSIEFRIIVGGQVAFDVVSSVPQTHRHAQLAIKHTAGSENETSSHSISAGKKLDTLQLGKCLMPQKWLIENTANDSSPI